MEETPTYRKKLPGVDRERSFCVAPEDGSGVMVQMCTPTHGRGVRTRSLGRETPGGEILLGRDEVGEATTADPEGILGSKPPAPRGLPDPKTGGGKVGETACAACLLGPGEPSRKASPAETAGHWREARRTTKILRRLTEAWKRDLATEKPQKTGH